MKIVMESVKRTQAIYVRSPLLDMPLSDSLPLRTAQKYAAIADRRRLATEHKLGNSIEAMEQSSPIS
jgi:hypothetical protein